MKDRISRPRFLDKSRALWRRECKRDPSLPPLSPVAGKVEVKDAVRVVLPIVGGEAVYHVAPVGGWRFELTSYDYSRPAPAGAKVAAGPAEVSAIVPPAATIVDQAKPDCDALLDLFVGLERRVCAFESLARAAEPEPTNVIHLNGVAAA